jgi:hypothetical protein
MPEEEKKSIQPDEIKKETKAKSNALTAGVIFFMLLIFILWLMNLPAIFKINSKKAATPININQLSSDFQASFNEAKAKIGNLKAVSPEDLQKYASQISTTSLATSTNIEK